MMCVLVLVSKLFTSERCIDLPSRKTFIEVL